MLLSPGRNIMVGVHTERPGRWPSTSPGQTQEGVPEPGPNWWYRTLRIKPPESLFLFDTILWRCSVKCQWKDRVSRARESDSDTWLGRGAGPEAAGAEAWGEALYFEGWRQGCFLVTSRKVECIYTGSDSICVWRRQPAWPAISL